LFSCISRVNDLAHPLRNGNRPCEGFQTLADSLAVSSAIDARDQVKWDAISKLTIRKLEMDPEQGFGRQWNGADVVTAQFNNTLSTGLRVPG